MVSIARAALEVKRGRVEVTTTKASQVRPIDLRRTQSLYSHGDFIHISLANRRARPMTRPNSSGSTSNSNSSFSSNNSNNFSSCREAMGLAPGTLATMILDLCL